MTLARLERHRLCTPGRTIVISDVHGHPRGFQALLDQLHFTAADRLVLLGDLVEKGPDSLGLLRQVMALAQRQQVLVLRGNCEDALCELGRLARGEPTQWLRNLSIYLRNMSASIIGQMMDACGLDASAAEQMKPLADTLYRAFRPEMDFLLSLPEIIETEHFVFVHAALAPGPLQAQDREVCLTPDAFVEQAQAAGWHFEKYCVVGHWPTCNYHHARHSFAPVVSHPCRIISIDGGHVVKPGGVLHALLIQDGLPDALSFVTHDPMPAVLALDDQPASPPQPLTVTWLDRFVQPLQPGPEKTLCRHLQTGRELWVPANQLLQTADGWVAPDCTNYHLPVRAGSRLHLLETGPLGALVRQGMDTGWYTGRLQPIA